MPKDRRTRSTSRSAPQWKAGAPRSAALYFPYAEAAGNAARAARPLVTLSQRGKDESDLVSAFVAEHGGGRSLGYVPIKARNRDCAAMVNRTSGKIVGYLSIAPW